jgi:hypothetical protein
MQVADLKMALAGIPNEMEVTIRVVDTNSFKIREVMDGDLMDIVGTRIEIGKFCINGAVTE